MAYQIDRYNNTILAVVEDGTIDQTTDLKFIGKNYAGYGEIQNENFLYLLENFSGANPPPRAISGQVWFDSASSKLKFFDGDQWRTTGGAEIGGTEPDGLSVGDFWWDSENDQLYVWNGTVYILVGPQNAGEGLTQMRSFSVEDSSGNIKNIIGSLINDEIVAIFSAEEFTLKTTQVAGTPNLEGFDRIKKGVTLKWTKLADNGVTNSQSVTGRDFWYWGTASNADKLGGRSATEYLLAQNAVFNTTVQFGDIGYTIGDDLDLRIYIENGNEGVIENQTGTNSVIKIKNKNGSGVTTTSALFNSNGMMPGANNLYTLGTSSNIWSAIYAANFVGEASKATTLRNNLGTYSSGSINAEASTVAVRDSSANLTANLFIGTATQARYADLAEKYTTEIELPAGTAVSVCTHTDHEVGPASSSNLCIGVVSTEPAIMMNSEAEGQYIALKGRVPVRVSGPVRKGQAVYAWQDGVCSTLATTGLVGVALETNLDEGEKLVECVLKV